MEIKELIVFIIGLGLGSVGMFLNFQAMNYNSNCQMPVYTDSFVSGKYHYAYTNFSEVNLPFLTDVIPIGRAIISVGDIFIFLSLGFLGYFIIGEVVGLITRKYAK